MSRRFLPALTAALAVVAAVVVAAPAQAATPRVSWSLPATAYTSTTTHKVAVRATGSVAGAPWRGTVIVQRASGTKWTTVSAKSPISRGRFAATTSALPMGSYRVRTVVLTSAGRAVAYGATRTLVVRATNGYQAPTVTFKGVSCRRVDDGVIDVTGIWTATGGRYLDHGSAQSINFAGTVVDGTTREFRFTSQQFAMGAGRLVLNGVYDVELSHLVSPVGYPAPSTWREISATREVDLTGCGGA